MPGIITYKTSSPSGDLISFLAGMKKIYQDLGKKAIIYQRLDMVRGDNAHDNVDSVCMDEKTFRMMKPLIFKQDYVEDYVVFDGQQADIDLDQIRMGTFTNQPLGSLNRWPAYCFPEMSCDLSKPWIDVYKTSYVKTTKNYYEKIAGKIIINFTTRHRNQFVHYFFLSKYQSQLVFAGLPYEHEQFCKTWKLDIPLLTVDDFEQLARAIGSCKFFLGNQSMCFQIAEAMKVPRILETFQLAPNVVPVGEHAYDFYHQGAVEFFMNKLNNL
jgi:hypothetical protein